MNCFFFIFAEDTLWTGNPGNYTDPDASKAISEVRELVDDGKYPEATTAAAKLLGNPSEVYHFLTFIWNVALHCYSVLIKIYKLQC